MHIQGYFIIPVRLYGVQGYSLFIWYYFLESTDKLKELLDKYTPKVCPLCGAIKDLNRRITAAQNNSELAKNIPAYQEGLAKLRTLKLNGIQAIMDTMPSISPPKVEEENQ